MKYDDSVRLLAAMTDGGSARESNYARVASLLLALPDVERPEHLDLLLALARRGHVRMENLATMRAHVEQACATLGAPAARGRRVA